MLGGLSLPYGVSADHVQGKNPIHYTIILVPHFAFPYFFPEKKSHENMNISFREKKYEQHANYNWKNLI